MKTIEYQTLDKSKWGDGPWQNEPDKRQWLDDATGLPCMIRRGPSGAWCGYVGVSANHPLFGVGMTHDDCRTDSLHVHGGITFTDHCEKKQNKETGICHLVEEGEDDNVWWFGFDCAHGGDQMPAFKEEIDRVSMSILTSNSYGEATKKLLNPIHTSFSGEYRDINYITKETLGLAQQLKDMAV